MRQDKAQIAHADHAVGKRIRFLRGTLSQEVFASKVGISRAALANYETGRTNPKPSVIQRISEAFEINADFLETGKVKNVEELAVSLGLGSNSADELTKDEWAVIRVLAVCNSDTVAAVLKTIVDGFKDDEEAKKLADYTTIMEDLSRLLTISSGQRTYQRGVRRGSLEGMIEALKRRMEQLLD